MDGLADEGLGLGFWWMLGAIAMALAVGLGAFGAHALRGRLDADGERRWNTAVFWHAPHALALFLVGLLAQPGQRLRPGESAAPWIGAGESAATWLVPAAGGCFVAGLVLFSGSLYALALTGRRRLGAITPLGGLAWLAGWILLGVAAGTGRGLPPGTLGP